MNLALAFVYIFLHNLFSSLSDSFCFLENALYQIAIAFNWALRLFRKYIKHMKKIFEIGVEAMNLVKVYPGSLYGGFKDRKLYENVGTYCMFIGYPRSGHSLIGALLDAHPNMIIAHELGALKYIHAGFSKRQIYHLLREKSLKFAGTGRKGINYSYLVPNQWHGRYKDLQIIGDKHGEAATLRLQARPQLLQRLRNVIDERITLIHVIRNPYDSIKTISLKTKRFKQSLKKSTEYYFSLCNTVMKIKKQIETNDLFELKHEDFIDDPKFYLKGLCNFLGVESSGDYLDDCASIVFKSSHKSRYDVQWSQELIDFVKTNIEKYSFLHGYTFNS